MKDGKKREISINNCSFLSGLCSGPHRRPCVAPTARATSWGREAKLGRESFLRSSRKSKGKYTLLSRRLAKRGTFLPREVCDLSPRCFPPRLCAEKNKYNLPRFSLLPSVFVLIGGLVRPVSRSVIYKATSLFADISTKSRDIEGFNP